MLISTSYTPYGELLLIDDNNKSTTLFLTYEHLTKYKDIIFDIKCDSIQYFDTAITNEDLNIKYKTQSICILENRQDKVINLTKELSKNLTYENCRYKIDQLENTCINLCFTADIYIISKDKKKYFVKNYQWINDVYSNKIINMIYADIFKLCSTDVFDCLDNIETHVPILITDQFLNFREKVSKLSSKPKDSTIDDLLEIARQKVQNREIISIELVPGLFRINGLTGNIEIRTLLRYEPIPDSDFIAIATKLGCFTYVKRTLIDYLSS